MAKRAHYPSISLPDAISRVRSIYNAEGPNNMSNEVAVNHMGYSSLSGTAMTTLASLKRYNLIEGRGDDLHISQDAVIIIVDEDCEDQGERIEALERSLAKDSIFSELLDRFGSKTTKLNVSSYLKRKGFKPNAADKAASAFIDSVRFVEEQKEGYNSNVSTEPEPTRMPTSSSQLSPEGAITAPIVISNVKDWPQITIPQPFTDKNWDDMMKLLNIMRPGLVTKSTVESTIEQEDGENDNNVDD